MLGNTYANQQCSIARTLESVGERWTLLVLRDVFMGLRRFEQIQQDLGIARNVLQNRLERLVEDGVLERVQYQERPPRYEYRLTEKGIDLWPVIESLRMWGDKHEPAPGGPPVIIRHKECGGEITEHRTCAKCGAFLGPRDVRPEAGPGISQDGERRLASRG